MAQQIAQNLNIPGVTGTITGPIKNPDLFTGPDGTITLGSIITVLLKYLYPIAGFILFVYIIIAGFQWLSSAGDPKKIESARQRLTYAILGFILLIASPWVARIVQLIFSPNEPFF